MAFVVLTGAAVLAGETTFVPRPRSSTSHFSFLSFLTWFWLLTQYRASQLGVFSFMTPVLGVILGVLLGIVIVSAYPWIVQLRSTRVRSAGQPKAS
jgi:drug/metabolite transporter (DMT)-like permease